MQILCPNVLNCRWLLDTVLVAFIVLSLCSSCYSLQSMSLVALASRKATRTVLSKLHRSCAQTAIVTNHKMRVLGPTSTSMRTFHGAPFQLNARKNAQIEDSVMLDSVEQSSAFEADLADFGSSGDVSFDHLTSSSAYKCQISPYWIEQMKLLERPAAKNLIAKLLPTNPLGFELSSGAPKKGTLLEHMISWKRQHPDQVILSRVGEFYETFGVDALMLVNYAGLNPMGGAARAGCPAKNVQATLDSLTQAGLSVAVFEEVSVIDAGRGPAASGKAKLKERVLSQIVSPASSTYIYNNMCLRSDDIEFRENRPAIGILRTVNGYTLCQVHLDTAVLVVSERLTEEGVRSLVASSGHIEPVYLQDCSPAELSFLSGSSAGGSSGTGSTSHSNTVSGASGASGGSGHNSHVFEKMTGYSESDFPQQVLRRLSRRMEISVDNIRVCNRNQLASLSSTSGTSSTSNSNYNSNNRGQQQLQAPLMPIYTSTALQIGLIANDNVPDLIPSLLPARCSAFSARFLRKWLLNPPPADIANHMRNLCTVLMGKSAAPVVPQAATAQAGVPQSTASTTAEDADSGVSMQKQHQPSTSSNSNIHYQNVPLVPRFTPLSIAKVVTLINRNQCNVALFKEIRHNLHALQVMLRNAHAYRDSLQSPTSSVGGGTISSTDTNSGAMSGSSYDHTCAQQAGDCSALVEPLLALTSYECGVRADYEQLLQETATVLEKIDFVIPVDSAAQHAQHYQQSQHTQQSQQSAQSVAGTTATTDTASTTDTTTTSAGAADVPYIDPYERIPPEFFIDNEREFRNKLLPSHPEVQVIYAQVDAAARALCEAVNTEFAAGFVVQYDINNNAIVLRNEYLPNGGRRRDKSIALPVFDTDRYNAFIDRKGVTVKKAYTTEIVSIALRRYLTATASAEQQVSQVLQQLSRALQGRHLISIVQAAHWAVILESVTLHSVSSKQRGWAVPHMVDFPTAENEDGEQQKGDGATASPAASAAATLELSGLSPYWMDRATCTLNPVQLQGLYLLTAPNMSGKSTLMRSVLVAALLANCGLCVPCSYASVPRYDHYFLRTASYDVPSEAKSAFALEMDDVRVMMRDCTHRSLVMIDELGKGTSAKDGSSLSGALLEHLDRRRISGIFATHLHELFLLPLQLDTVREKKMGYSVDDAGDVRWNYLLEEGRCVDSMALVTARKYGIDASIVHRASALAETFDRLCRSGQNTSSPEASTGTEPSTSAAASGAMNRGRGAVLESQAADNTVSLDSAASYEAEPVPEPSVRAKPLPPGRRYNLNSDVVPLMRAVGSEFSASAAPGNQVQVLVQVIPAAWETPAALEGSACVYVLQIFSLTKENLPDLLYVGETESIRQRLKQHRDTYKAKGYSFSAAVLAVRDKSAARRVETTLINSLKVRGFDIENDTDSKHVLFSASSRK